MRKRSLLVILLLIGVTAGLVAYFIQGDIDLIIKEKGVKLTGIDTSTGVVSYSDYSFTWNGMEDIKPGKKMEATLTLTSIAEDSINCTLSSYISEKPVGATEDDVRVWYTMSGSGKEISELTIGAGATIMIDINIKVHGAASPGAYTIVGTIAPKI